MINHRSTVDTRSQSRNKELFLDVAAVSLKETPAAELPRKNGNNLFGRLFGQKVGRPEAEVFISYGDLANLQTLSNYGFVEQNNRCNVEQVTVKVLGRGGVPVFVQSDGIIDEEAIATLRGWLLNTMEEEILPEDMRQAPVYVSPRNEEEVCALVAGYAEESLYEAEEGANVAARQKDSLVVTYLRERAQILQAALDKIQQEFPHLFT
jgi:hypothetical protein